MATYASNDDKTRRNPYDPRTGSTGDDAEPTPADERHDEQPDDAAGDGDETSGRPRERQHSDHVVDRTGEHDPGTPDQFQRR